jgi:hypothetical protein
MHLSPCPASSQISLPSSPTYSSRPLSTTSMVAAEGDWLANDAIFKPLLGTASRGGEGDMVKPWTVPRETTGVVTFLLSKDVPAAGAVVAGNLGNNVAAAADAADEGVDALCDGRIGILAPGGSWMTTGEMVACAFDVGTTGRCC